MKCQGTVLVPFVLGFPCVGMAAAQVTAALSVDSGGIQGNGASMTPVLSFDGRFAAFASSASNLGAPGQDGLLEVFLRDRLAGSTSWISSALGGATPDGSCFVPALSADGRFVAFASDATNLVPGDTNASCDVFVYDTQQHQTLRASVDSAGSEGNDLSIDPRLSGDGGRVAFWSYATNLAPDLPPGYARVYVHDFADGTTSCASLGSAGQPANADAFLASISADGRFVVFWSRATNLFEGAADGTAQVFVRDLLEGTTSCASISSGGVPGDGDSTHASISGDGRYVAFESGATNLVQGDTNGCSDVFVRDTLEELTIRASLSSAAAQADGPSGNPALSADGAQLAFESSATNLAADDTNGFDDVFVRDLLHGQTRRASLDSSSAQANGPSQNPALSGDGRQAAFDSDATNLVAGDGNGTTDAFVRVQSAPAEVFCFGDGNSGLDCPCANNGFLGQGCDNSAATGGALLSVAGSAQPDSLVFGVEGMTPHALAILVQGDASSNPPVFFGDGLRCVAGTLRALYVRTAIDGSASAPSGDDLSVSARSAQLGDPIEAGTTRVYQVCYRDRSETFCPAPTGNVFNASNAVRIYW